MKLIQNAWSKFETYTNFLVVIVGVRLIIFFFLFFRIYAIVVGHVVIALLKSLSFSFAPTELSMLFVFPLGKHDNVLLEFSILLDSFQ